jgi:uncharacterized protein (TIGR03086 family)
MSELAGLYKKALDEFGSRVQAVPDDKWDTESINPGWSVRTLVNHVAGENLWFAPIFEGKTVEEVGDALDGDLLGDDPKAGWERSAEVARRETEKDVDAQIVHLSFGPTPGRAYIGQVLCDHVLHAWDLARSLGLDDGLDPELVEFTYKELTPQAEAWRQGGAFAAAVDVPESADTKTRLLAMTGRKP